MIEIPKKDAMDFFNSQRKEWKLKDVNAEECMNYILSILDDEIQVNNDTFTFKVSGHEVQYFEDNFEYYK